MFFYDNIVYSNCQLLKGLSKQYIYHYFEKEHEKHALSR